MTLRNHCQKAGRSTSDPERAAPESYIAELFPHRPPMAMAETQIVILKVIVSAQFFSSCYFKVQLLHNVTLKVLKNEISQEVDPLVKTFLWIILKDQKSYEKIYPTGKEFAVPDDVLKVSIIDKHLDALEYCTNVVRFVMPEKIQEYLSCHLVGPDMNPEEIRIRASCSWSHADKYSNALTQIWAFLKDYHVKINTHFVSQNQSADYSKPFETVDTVSVLPTQ